MRHVTVRDVMTTVVVTVGPTAGFRQIADLLVSRAVSAVPVVDDQAVVLGVVSEADLLPKLEYADRLPHHPLATRRMRAARHKAASDRAADLMTKPPVTVGPEVSVSQAARMLEAARVKRLPVTDDEGRLVGIVSRRDLVRTYVRTDAELRASVLDIIDAMWIDPATVEVDSAAGVVHLGGQLDRRSTAQIVTNLVRSTPGVVDVVDEFGWDYDDSDRRLRHRPEQTAGVLVGPRK